MRVRRLTLKNYRGFADATLDLDRLLTVLFGVNGSGKSSVLTGLASAAIDLLRASPSRPDGTWAMHLEDHDIRLGSERIELGSEWINAGRSEHLSRVHSRGQPRSFQASATSLASFCESSPIILISYGSSREVAVRGESFANPLGGDGLPEVIAESATHDALAVGHLKFRSLFQWFKSREDAENERKVASRDLTLEDPHLAAVRRAVAGLLPGYSGLRVQRDPLHMVIRKGDALLAIDQLSDGERLLLALAADLARRLAITYPDAADPLAGEAIVLIDEIELHLHPTWQRRVLGALRNTFPGCQFIVTTHSPQVLSEVPNDAVVLVKDFQFVRPGAPTAGRDSNAILTEAMGTPDRPAAQTAAIESIAALLDAGRNAEAKVKLDALARDLSERDREVVELRTMLHFLGGDDAAHPQGS